MKLMILQVNFAFWC